MASKLERLLKAVTITELLTDAMTPHLPSIITPWMLGLLGVSWSDPDHKHDVTHVVVQGPWRADLLTMRSYWQSRVPTAGPSISSVSELQSSGGSGLKNYTASLAGWIAGLEGSQSLARSATSTDDTAITAATNELLKYMISGEAVTAAAGTPTAIAGTSVQARLRAVRVLDLLRTTNLHTCLIKENKLTTLAELDSALERVDNRGCTVLGSGRRIVDMFWHRAVIRVPGAPAASDMESMLHWSSPTSESRGALLQFQPRMAGLITPVTLQEKNLHDAIFEHGTQEVRELMAIGANSTLQLTTAASHFAFRHCDLLSGSKLALLTEILTAPGVFERNIKLDEQLPTMMQDMCQRGYNLGTSIGNSNVAGTVCIFDRNLHSRMPLVPTPARFKRAARLTRAGV
jgi:hypothetical protein